MKGGRNIENEKTIINAEDTKLEEEGQYQRNLYRKSNFKV